ncbi:MAG: hypothetical protein CMP22_07335 [Rickettsiales bacterium]|nr:hypothetical protein [Rickettsiales bacterium]|tara:strand:+ start:773 stop:1246 length:474 start_codon:yes stop_codon:yes gene_type:complete
MKLIPNQDGLLDISIGESGGIVSETTIETALLSSLLLNRRADLTDPLPYGYKGKTGALTDDRQGWVGDIFDDKGRLVGSKLWLLDQELATNENRLRAHEYIRQATQWSIDDGYVSKIDIIDEWSGQDRLNIKVTFHMTNGQRFNLKFNYETGDVYVL